MFQNLSEGGDGDLIGSQDDSILKIPAGCSRTLVLYYTIAAMGGGGPIILCQERGRGQTSC